MRFTRNVSRASVASLLLGWAAPVGAQGSDLSSGGLAPPPAVESQEGADAEPGTTDTEQELSRAEQEDSGRGLEFVWLAGEAGVGHFGFGAIDEGDLGIATGKSQTGFVAGAGLGVRLIYFTVGARFRYAPLPDVTLWTLGAEGGLHIPLGALEPYFTLGLGYVSVTTDIQTVDLDARGFDGRLGAGVDYYLTNMFSVGANLTGDILFLSGRKLTDSNVASPEDGSSIGAGVTFTAVMGLHF
jgi:opacity protein-like surface antigen